MIFWLLSGMGPLQNVTRESLPSMSTNSVLPQQQHFGIFGSSNNANRGVSPTPQGRNTPTFSHPPPNLYHQRLNYNSHSSPSNSSNYFGSSSNFGMNFMRTSSSPTNMAQQRNSFLNRNDSLSSNTFDPSEFPSLGQKSTPNSSLSNRPNYVGMVKQPTMESNEFTISKEDFPALPGSSSNSNSGNHAEHHPLPFGQQDRYDRMTSQGLSQENNHVALGVSQIPAGKNSDVRKKDDILTSPGGTVRNIPSSMVTDQFGMIGLLTFIRAAETDSDLVSLALGANLTTLGLNLNSEVSLHPTFGGPWAKTPCRPQDIDFHVPHEYLVNQSIREKLAPVKLNRYKDDVLFYMFYTNVGDVLQLAAAAELYNRDWRYHIEDRIWITRAPGIAPSEKTSTYERGTYYYFDVASWCKVPKDSLLEYDKLEDRPSLPTNHGGGNNHSNQAANIISPTVAQSVQQDSSVPLRPCSPVMAMSLPHQY